MSSFKKLENYNFLGLLGLLLCLSLEFAHKDHVKVCANLVQAWWLGGRVLALNETFILFSSTTIINENILI